MLISKTMRALKLLLVGVIFGSTGPVTSAPMEAHRNPIPPRLQWEANGGYCGEVSFISAGLYYGQYLSQFDARAAAIGRTPQNEGELLLGSNDRRAARELRLRAENWDGRKQRSEREFLAWVKRHVLAGHPVIIGVFNNENTLYGRTDPEAGDPQYDHIVPVSAIRSRHPLSEGRYFPTDKIVFSDNGLFGSANDHPFLYRYVFHRFPGNRRQANVPDGALYTLPDYGRNYGVAILGVEDHDGETLPVRLETSRISENPSMSRGSNQRPRSRRLTLTVTVSGLEPGVDYNLYRYDRLAAIPVSGFNAHAGDAAENIPVRIAAGSSFSFIREIQSDDVVAFRCVRANAR